jgi:hypothetical protein
MCAGIEGGQRGSGRVLQFECSYILGDLANAGDG